MYTLFGDPFSGNCYKVELTLHLLDKAYTWVKVDVLNGETRTPEFLAMNPNGKVPVLRTPDGDYLWESNAILHHLAEGTPLIPEVPRLRTQVLQWQFFEQYSHEPYVAVARFIQRYLGLPDAQRTRYEQCHIDGYRALDVMEKQLQQTPYIVDHNYSLADITLYAYTHVADEGGFDLKGYPAIRDWLARVAQHPRHIAIGQSAAAQSASKL